MEKRKPPLKLSIYHSGGKSSASSALAPKKKKVVILNSNENGSETPYNKKLFYSGLNYSRAHSQSKIGGNMLKVLNHKSFADSAQPLTPSIVLENQGGLLSKHEYKEVLNYKEIFFLGSKSKLESNFEDEEGYYIVTIGDHLAYRYEIISQLGTGSFGNVVKCKDHKSNEIVAIKILKKKYGILKYGQKENDVLNTIQENDSENNNCIVEKIDNFYFRGHYCIVFEYLDLNVYEFLSQNNFNGLLTGLVKRITIQVLTALKHIHSLGIIHCDIKPENIVFKNKTKQYIKLIDFGSTCTIGNAMRGYIQSRFYRAPEIIIEAPYNEKIDIWSVGCIIFEMITGNPLFQGENEFEVFEQMVKILGWTDFSALHPTKKKIIMLTKGKNLEDYKGNTLKKILSREEKSLIDFVMKCLEWDKDNRISAEAALQHPWIKSSRGFK